jgi:hypothetical protein
MPGAPASGPACFHWSRAGSETGAPLAFLSVLWLVTILSCASARAATNIEPARVKEIAAMLAPTPASFGQPITNRTAWLKAAANPALRSLLSDAETMARNPDPELPDGLYLDFSRTGNRDRAQKVQFERSTRLTTFALAECVENRGRFLKPLQKTIETLCAEKSWLYPAHDGKLDVFEGRAMNPDLRATTLAFDLATADYLLGDKLPAATRQLTRDNVRRRVLQPYRDMVEGRREEMFWIHATHNWNAVCLAGTTGAALALEDSPQERAWFIAAAENYIQYFLRGFTPDGYCSEGVGYWNYGFGRFVILTETIRQATGGKDDLFKLPSVVQPALFSFRAEILNGIYPSIADCSPGSRPDPPITRYVAQRLGLAKPADVKASVKVDSKSLAASAMFLFQENSLPIAQRVTGLQDSPLRTWFSDGGVLIARPKSGDAAPFAVVLKGGHNAENHNHNDVGSLSVVAGRSMVICDPGGEVYTKRTFGPRRYDSRVINSFGHAVPVVAGKLQSTGASARAVVRRADFSDDEDTLALDIRSAYAVPDLKKLERTFVYRRGANAALIVSDEVAFDKPETFESALITWGKWKKISANEIEITDDAGAVRVKIDTGGVPFEIRDQKIDEDVHTPKKPWHLGIILKAPVTTAKVILTITPAPAIAKHDS